jgi:hypothetical protein
MGSNGTVLDSLPPEARFAIRAFAAGLSFDDAAEVLRADGETARKHLRTVVRATGASPPPPSSGDDALRAALAPALELAARPPARVPGTQCPPPDIAADLALGRLDGPLMLATAEHAADCPACLAALARTRRSPPPGPAAAPPPPARGIDAPLVVGALAGIALVVWYLLFS